ncbi:hypothetical protein, partial [Treponema succinifaciens]|uniref:hypothetical protein n=1 Tax=Treponema succinifaciens TaxID=167 RepID=UPI0023F761A4
VYSNQLIKLIQLSPLVHESERQNPGQPGFCSFKNINFITDSNYLSSKDYKIECRVLGFIEISSHYRTCPCDVCTAMTAFLA